MLKEIRQKIRKRAGEWLVRLAIGVAIVFAIGSIVALAAPQKVPENTPDHLLLKSSSEKIRGFYDLDATTTKYQYVTEKEAKKTKYSRDLDKELTEDISKRTENVQFFLMKKDKKEETWGGKFYLDKAFYKDDVQEKWFETDWGTTTKKAFKKQMKAEEVSWLKRLLLPEIYAVTATTAVGTGDGSVSHNHADWDTVHDANTGTAAAFAGARDTYAQVWKAAGPVYHIYKGFKPIWTGALPDNCTVIGGKLYMNVSVKGDTAGDGWIVVVQTSQANTGDLRVEDYDQCGAIDNPDEGSDRVTIAGITTGVFTAWTLNATGTAWISKTATTTLGVRERYDVTDTVYGVEGASYIRTHDADQTGTTEDPYLWIEYTVPSPEAALPSMNAIFYGTCF